MAARNFTEQAHTMQRGVVKLFCTATGGGSGAQTFTLTNNAGSAVASVVQADSGAGVVTITLADKYAALLGAHVTIGHATYSTINEYVGNFTSEAVSSSKTVVFSFGTVAGEAADLPASTILLIELTLKNTSR